MSEEKRLTMERIEEIRPADSWMSFWRTPVITIELRQLCDLALSALSQEAVRDEARDEALDLGQFVNAASIGAGDSPHQVVEKLQRAINAAALKREPNAAGGASDD